MANTYSQITLHFVFSPKNRESLIQASFQERLHRYITGIVEGKRHKMLAINSMPDHIHMLIGFDPYEAPADLVRDIKSDSTLFINDNHLSRFKFQWQEGYGVFSYSRSQRDSVIRYIMEQEEHHKKNSFKREYMAILKNFDIPFEENYLFEFFE